MDRPVAIVCSRYFGPTVRRPKSILEVRSQLAKKEWKPFQKIYVVATVYWGGTFSTHRERTRKRSFKRKLLPRSPDDIVNAEKLLGRIVAQLNATNLSEIEEALQNQGWIVQRKSANHREKSIIMGALTE